jgi:hypothetical protein
MPILIRKRKRTIQLNNRWGSRRNRILFVLSLSLAAVASWLLVASTEVPLQRYLVATSNIATSSTLGEANLSTQEMDLKEGESQYLKATDQNLRSWVLVRPVNAGELIPMSAIAPVSNSECAQVVVDLAVRLASTVREGEKVDLWAAEQANSLESIPTQVVTAGELVSIKMATDSFSQSIQTIEICVSPGEIRSLVSAIARKSTIIGIRAQG